MKRLLKIAKLPYSVKPESSDVLSSKNLPDSIILPETHSPMYLIHKYWARKPANVVAEYIRKYSEEGETILDPFFGSGVTLFESILLKRNAIGLDINPFCSFLVKTMFLPWSEWDLLNAIKAIEINIAPLFKELYQFSCPKCHEISEISHIIYSNHSKQKETNGQKTLENVELQENNKESITDIYWSCPTCGNQKTTVDSIIAEETKRIKRIEANFQEYVKKYEPKYPCFKFRYENGNNFIQLRHDLIKNPDSSLLFTKRALIALGVLYKEICSIDCEERTREHLKLIFSASISQASKMVWVIKNRKNKAVKNKEAGSWTHHFFWNPHEFFEVNVWNCFQARLVKLIAGKKDFENRIYEQLGFKGLLELNNHISINSGEIITSKPQDRPFLEIINHSSRQISLPNDSVGFIFTDPPYGDSIQYMELSSVWNVWLGLDTATNVIERSEKEEITMNSRQGKDLDRYKKMLFEVFSECYRVLKDNRFMVVTFHNTDLKIRNALIQSATDAGFLLEQITYQMPPRVSVKSMLHHSGTPIGDLFIRFKKDQKNRRSEPPKTNGTIKEEIIKRCIEDIIVRILQERAEPTNWIWISTFLDQELFKQKLYPVENIDEIIHEISKSGRFKVREGYEWWFAKPENEKIPNHPLSQRIEEQIVRIIKENPKLISQAKEKTEKQYIYNELYKIFSGTLTPDKLVVSSILEKHVKLRKGG